MHWKAVLLLLLSGCSGLTSTSGSSSSAPLVDIKDVDPTIIVEARYFGDHNFLGRPVKGYAAGKCLLTKEAAAMLAAVQADFRTFNYSLKVYDCYRPQRAVNDFIEWAKDLKDQKMKAEFYPRVKKEEVFKLGYVAEKSGHSRGSTVDLTVVKLPVGPQDTYTDQTKLVDCAAPPKKRFKDNSIDMGTGYDCFDPKAWTMNDKVPTGARKNRLMLKTAMEKRGFKNYEQEWWHFTLTNEPFPDTYFDVEIK